MIERIRRLTDLQEAVLVIIISLGLPIYFSVRGLFTISTGPTGQWTYPRSDSGIIILLTMEVLSLAIIAYILNNRNWKLSDINFKVSFKTFLHGVSVLFVTLFLIGTVFWLINVEVLIDKGKISTIKTEHDKNYLVWGLLLLINSIFEEFIYNGYLYKKLKNSNKGMFLIISSTLRVTIHLYQGVIGIISTLIAGLTFGAYYTRYRLLTSLIIAHGLWNLLMFWRG